MCEVTQYKTSKGPEREEAVDMSREDLKSGSRPPQMTKTWHTEQLQALQWQIYPGGSAAYINTQLNSQALLLPPTFSEELTHELSITSYFPIVFHLLWLLTSEPTVYLRHPSSIKLTFKHPSSSNHHSCNNGASPNITLSTKAHFTTLAEYPIIQLTAHFCDELET